MVVCCGVSFAHQFIKLFATNLNHCFPARHANQFLIRMYFIYVRMKCVEDVALIASFVFRGKSVSSFFMNGLRRGLVPAKSAPGRLRTSVLVSSLRSFSQISMGIIKSHWPLEYIFFGTNETLLGLFFLIIKKLIIEY